MKNYSTCLVIIYAAEFLKRRIKQNQQRKNATIKNKKKTIKVNGYHHLIDELYNETGQSP